MYIHVKSNIRFLHPGLVFSLLFIFDCCSTNIVSTSIRGLHILQPIQVEINEEDEHDGKGHGGSSDFDDEDDIGMGRGGGGDDWEDDKPRQPTPAYVNRLYKPRTPPTWPTPSEGATGFGS